MKANTALRVVENNSHASKDFTIQASGKMFHMVISGLYSNKPQSITREIWSNAYDAHAMVGKEDVPFLVTFPTSLSPTFSCRDFGPGIAPEDMEGFYTVLGHSTKENTNKAVGKWGVGRMSPMSYTDTFSVVSYHKGGVTYYSVQLGPDGSPQLHVLAETMPTTEPDGLEVSFPVHRSDIHLFQTAAEVVSYGFDIPPRIVNSKEKEFKPVKKTFEGKGFYLYEDSRLSGAYAQMGCVLYPIPGQYLPRTMKVVYQFDIGDLEVTASREALSFGPNDPTAANITKKAKEVEEALWKDMQAKIDAEPRLFLASRLAHKLRASVSHNSPAFTYKGVAIPKFWDCSTYKNIAISVGYKGYRQKQAGWGIDDSITIQNEYTIFVQDLGDAKSNVRAATRIGSALASYSYYIWVRANLNDAQQKMEVDTLISNLGYDVKYVKDLPDVGPSGRTRTKVKVSLLVNSGRNPYDMDDTEFQAGGYYYAMTNNDYPNCLLNMGTLAKEKLGVQRMILVPKTLWKKFEGNSKWQPIMPALEAALKLEEPEAKKRLSVRYNLYPMNKLEVFRGVTGPVGDFAREVIKPRDSLYMGMSFDTWNRVLQHFNLPPLGSGNKAADEYHKLLDTYPLLKVYVDNEGSCKKHLNDFVIYILAIDNADKE